MSLPGRAWTALFFAALHLFFGVRAVLPQQVFCHKASGRTDIEFQISGAGCLCDECEHCRARLMRPQPDSRSSLPAFQPCHCQHELILSDIGHSSLDRPERESLLLPEAAIVQARPGDALQSVLLTSREAAGAWVAAGPPGGVGSTIIRC
jgi:hypothetical protein